MTNQQAPRFFSERTNVRGYALNVQRAGATGSQVVVLVHGIGVSSRYFLPYAAELAKCYDVRVLDLPGYGETPDPKRILSISELSDVVGEYIREEAAAPAVLIGHSMGCQIVAHTARHYTELCDKVILLGPTVNKWERTRWLQLLRLVQDVAHEPVVAGKVVLGDYLRMGLWRYIATSKFMIDDRIEQTLDGCQLPVMIVRGSCDKIVPKKWVEYLASTLTHAEVREVAGAPHIVHIKGMELLTRLSKTFIER